MKKTWLFCAALCLIAAIATGCGQSGTTEATTTEETGTTATTPAEETGTAEATSAPAAAGAPTITIADMSYGEPITVAPGAQVTVRNDDSVEHSVTSQPEAAFDVHVDGGQQGTFTAPTEPGEYEFYCVYHPSMKGTLIVK